MVIYIKIPDTICTGSVEIDDKQLRLATRCIAGTIIYSVTKNSRPFLVIKISYDGLAIGKPQMGVIIFVKFPQHGLTGFTLPSHFVWLSHI